MSDYSKAKAIILDAWRKFRENVNDFLPDYPLNRGDNLKTRYLYYDELDSEMMLRLQKDYRSFGELVSSTVIGDHCRGQIYDCLSKIEGSVKNQNIDEFLRRIYELFGVYRKIIIVLERCPF